MPVSSMTVRGAGGTSWVRPDSFFETPVTIA